VRSGVYVIECCERQYIGSARHIRARWATHCHELRKGIHHSRFLQRAWEKYGEDAFTFRVIEECEPERCVEREQYWIDVLAPVFNMHLTARSPLGVNRSGATRAKLSMLASMRIPPMTNKHHTEETNAKLRGRVVSEATRNKLRNRIVSEETRAKIRAARLGKARPQEAVEASAAKLRGRKRPLEVGEKIRVALTGVKHTEQRRANNCDSHIGQVITDAQKAKISASLKGRPSPMRGRTTSPEHRAKISASLRAYTVARRAKQKE
jgi:group I intron endonuclease